MPIKIPKGLRRRSSGNVLDTIENPPGQDPPPTSSFRVLERRPVVDDQSFHGGQGLKRTSAARPRSTPIANVNLSGLENAASQRGSDAHNSSSGRGDDTSGSARYSLASTNPSSVDYDSPNEDAIPSYARPPHSRFGNVLSVRKQLPKAAQSAPALRQAPLPPLPPLPTNPLQTPQPRERSVTESSYASTATPPQLDFGTDMDWVDSEYGSGLGDFLNKLDAQTPAPIRSESAPIDSSKNFPRPRQHSPSRFDTGVPDSSPFSVASVNSRDPLLSPPPVPRHGFAESPLQRADSIQADDTEANMVRGTVRRSTLAPPTRADPRVTTPTSPSSDPWARSGNSPPPPEEPLFDSPMPSEQARSIPYRPHAERKVSRAMTQAEFERYRQNAGESDDDDDEATYDDEDDAEKLRDAAKQRRKQEANLAIYRQQMKKVTGEQPGELPSSYVSRPSLATASLSAPNLTLAMSGMSSPVPVDEDEDEDVPLGVLQAHGFPSKARPPMQLRHAASQGNFRPVSQLGSYPAPPGSTRNEVAAGGGGSVPIFARKLPADLDPYLGASLVNQSNRAAMSQHQSLPSGGLVGIIDQEQRERLTRRGSPNTQGTYGPTPLPPPMPMPAPYHPAIPRTMSMGNIPDAMQMGMGAYGPQVPMSPAEQATMQMSNSFTQMMQMQMQMMQQMMQMQGMTPQQQQMLMQQQQNLSMMQSQMTPQDPRMSIASQAPSQFGHQRSASSLSRPIIPGQGWAPSVMGVDSGAGYAPSIAPSERSNVGQPSRYRPVTASGIPSSSSQYAGQPIIRSNSRSSTMTTATAMRLQQDGDRFRHASSAGVPGFRPPDSLTLHRPTSPPRTTIRAVSRPKYSAAAAGNGSVIAPAGSGDDEDDEEGWRELAQKKEARKSRWKRKFGMGSFGAAAGLQPPSQASGSRGTSPVSNTDTRASEGEYYDHEPEGVYYYGETADEVH